MSFTRAMRRGGAPAVIGAGLTLGVVLVWQALTAPPPALAQVPDAGLQRIEMIQQMKLQTQKLDIMIGLLKEIRDGKTPAAPPAKPKPE